MNKRISIVVPSFNEEDSILSFYLRMTLVLNSLSNYDAEIIFVNDGSDDGTEDVIDTLIDQDPRIRLVSLSRNFGKELAMTAGLDHASGDAVAIFDADLQDPPELLLDFVQKWEAGFDVVYAKRSIRKGESWLKKTTASIFYVTISHLSEVYIPADTGDCRLMSRRVVTQLLRLREHHRFMKGLFAWVGFSSIAIEYNRNSRSFGKSKFNYWNLWNFALEGITSFSIAPLKIAMYLGFLVALISFLFGAWIIFKTLYWGDVVRGYPTLIVTILFLGGIQLFFIGVLGEYIGRIFGETKNRPLYIVGRLRNSELYASTTARL